MSGFVIVRLGRESTEPFAGYLYEIRKDGRRVASLRHSHRGEDYCIRTSSLGQWQDCDRILDGGGPEPLGLNDEGLALLARLGIH